MKNKCSALCMVFFLFFTPLVLNAQSPVSLQRAYDEAEFRFQRGFWPGALERYEYIIAHSREASSGDALFRKAQCLYFIGKTDDALVLFEKLAAKPQLTRFSLSIPYWLGVLYYEKGMYGEAAVMLRKSIESPADEETRKNSFLYLARSLTASGRDAEAVPVLETLLARSDIGANFTSVLQMLFASYDRQEQYEKNAALYNRLDVSVLPASASQRIGLFVADALAALGRNNEALALYGSLMSAQEKDIAISALQKAYALTEKGGNSALLDTFIAGAESSLAAYPAVLCEFWGRMGIDAFDAGDYAKASAYFDRFYSAAPGSASLKNLIPLYSAEITRRDKGPLAASAQLSVFLPGAGRYRPQYLLALAQYAASENKWQEVLTYTSDFFKSAGAAVPAAAMPRSQDEAAAYLHADALFNIGRYAEAASFLELFLNSAAAKAPEAKLVSLYADALMYSGRNADARAVLAKLDNPGTEDRMRLVYADLFTGNNAEALKLSSDIIAAPVSAGGRNADMYKAALYAGGLAAFNLGNWKTAEALLGEYTADFSKKGAEDGVYTPFAVYYLAYSRYRLGNYAEALDGFNTFIDTWPYHGLSWNAALNGALCALQAGSASADRAYALASLAVKTARADKEKNQAVLLFAGILSDRGQYAEGIELLLPASSGYGEYAADSSYLLADMYARQGSRDKADEQWEAIILRFPRDPVAEQASYRRGEFHYGIADWANAARYFTQYRRSYPEGRFIEAALYFGGDSFARSGNQDSAILQWENLVSSHSRSAYEYAALRGLMGLYRNKGEYQAALAAAESLLAKFPVQAETAGIKKDAAELKLLAQGLEEKTAVQLALFTKAGKAATAEGRRAGLELASLYAASPDSRNATVSLLEDIASYTGDTETAAPASLLLGTCYREAGEYEKASAALLKAAKYYASMNNEKAAEALYGAADAFDLMGKRGDALGVINTLKTAWPDSIWTERASLLIK